MLPMKNNLKLLALSTVAALALTGCQTTQKEEMQKPTTSVTEVSMSKQSRLDHVLEKAAIESAHAGQQQQSLSYLEKIYKRNSSDQNAAYGYAKALREGGMADKANLVLSPFAFSDNVHTDILVEFSHIQSSLGNYVTAEEYAKRALSQDMGSHKAQHALGIALDAQGRHKSAETAFRSALDTWQGDPIPLLNNLALCLAAQGYLDESVMLLQKAHNAMPNRTEIERNLRIIQTLREATPSFSPRPVKKPPES